MAHKEISELTAASGLDGTELVHIVQSSNSRRTTTWDIGHIFRGAMVTRSGGTLTGLDMTSGYQIPFNSELYDTNSFHDNSTNPERLTIPSGVTRVRLSANVWVSDKGSIFGSDEWLFMTLLKNGSSSFDGAVQQSNDLNQYNVKMSLVSPVLEVSAGDYFTLNMQTEADTDETIYASTLSFGIEVIT
jgi:hypothetical protein